MALWTVISLLGFLLFFKYLNSIQISAKRTHEALILVQFNFCYQWKNQNKIIVAWLDAVHNFELHLTNFNRFPFIVHKTKASANRYILKLSVL